MFKSKIVTVLSLIFFVNSNVFADLVFSAPPRGTEVDERATYEPMVFAMSRAIGEKIRYVYPRDFNEYSSDMQKGRYDIVFDGPHFSQWRVINLHHTLLVNLPENLQFLIIAPVADSNINTLKDLVFESVCAQWTPQLGTLMLLQNYYDRMVEPNLHLVHGEDKVYSEFENKKCTAAVLRDKSFYKMSEAQRAAYKVVYKSPIAPNDAITADDKVSPAQRKALVALLTNPKTAKVAHAVFDRFSKNATAFVVAKPEQFKGLDQLLLLAFGWRKR